MDIGTILTGIGAFGVITGNGMIIKFLWSRQNMQSRKIETQDKKFATMEAVRKKELYQDDGQTNYVLRKEHDVHCKEVQETFCKKVDETKELIKDMKTFMERKEIAREKAKDLDHEVRRVIGERLAGIEAKLL